jgi:biopolymer transport protein ExbD
MNIWKMRHEGAPEVTENLSFEQIITEVQEGTWDPSDEVVGPNDTDWQSLETHPAFAEIMADIEPPEPIHPPDETRLDMNPLIDVALVLLIFFILTTTYEELRKELPSPPAPPEDTKSTQITDQELANFTIRVIAKMENAQPVVRVEGEVVTEDKLQEVIEAAVAKTGYRKLAVEIDPLVPWKVFIAIQDAATGAKIEETIRIVRRQKSES